MDVSSISLTYAHLLGLATVGSSLKDVRGLVRLSLLLNEREGMHNILA
jgi:hypothetical protein